MLTVITSQLSASDAYQLRRKSNYKYIFVFPFPESLLLSVTDCFVVIVVIIVIVIVAGSESFGLKNKNYFSPFIKKKVLGQLTK